MVEKKRDNFTKMMAVIIGILLLLILITSVLLFVRPLIHGRYQERLVEKNLALGNRYLSEMEYDKAVTSFSKVVRIDDQNTEAHIGLGHAYSGLGKWVEAADSYDHAVQTVVERAFTEHPERKETGKTVIRDQVMKKAELDDSSHEYFKGEELAAIDAIVDYAGGPWNADQDTEPAGRYEIPTPELIMDLVVQRNDATEKAVEEIRENGGDLSPYQDFIDWYEQGTPIDTDAGKDSDAADTASSDDTADSNETLELLRPFLGGGWSSASMDVDQDGNPTPYISAVIYETYIEKHYSSGEVYRDEISSVEKDSEGIMIKMADGQAYFAPEDSTDTLWRYFDWERRADNMSGSDSLYRSNGSGQDAAASGAANEEERERQAGSNEASININAQLHTAYLEYLEKYQGDVEKASNRIPGQASGQTEVHYFDCRDLNNDGIDELITLQIENMRYEIIRIFTLAKDGTLRPMVFSDGSEAVFDNNHQANGSYNFFICKNGHIHNEYIGGGIIESSIYIPENNVLVSYLYQFENSMVQKRTYKQNDQDITYKEFESLTKNCDIHDFTWTNNDANGRRMISR